MSDMPKMTALEEDVLMLLIKERKKSEQWEAEYRKQFEANGRLYDENFAFRRMLPILDQWLKELPVEARGMASERLTKELLASIQLIHTIHREQGRA